MADYTKVEARYIKTNLPYRGKNLPHQLYVRKVPDEPQYENKHMWICFCTCGMRPIKYWSFGAVLGAGLEHQRRGYAGDRIQTRRQVNSSNQAGERDWY